MGFANCARSKTYVCFHTAIQRCCYVITMLTVRHGRIVITPWHFYSHLAKLGPAAKLRMQKIIPNTGEKCPHAPFTGREWGGQAGARLAYNLHNQQSWVRAEGKAWQEVLVNQYGRREHVLVLLYPQPEFIQSTMEFDQAADQLWFFPHKSKCAQKFTGWAHWGVLFGFLLHVDFAYGGPSRRGRNKGVFELFHSCFSKCKMVYELLPHR